MDIATLGLKVDSSGVVKGVQDLDRLDAASARAEGSAGKLGGAFNSLKTAIAALGIGVVVKEFLDGADKMALLDARLKLATGSMQDFNQARAEAIRLSNDNKTDIESTVTLYTKLADPVKRLGGGVTETAGIVDAFSKTLLVSGASTQEANAAIQQFGQAMASGKLQGDEFRSMAEASPRFMKAIADGAGIPIERLKEMASEGKLTADVVGGALLKELIKLKQEAATMPTTGSMAIQQLKNDVLLAVAEINSTGNMSGGFVSMIEAARELVPAIKTELVDMAQGANEWFERNKEALGDAWEMAKGLGAQIWNLVEGAAQVVGFIVDWAVQSGTVKTIIESLRLIVAGIQDGVEFIGAAFAKVGAVIVDFVIGAFEPFVKGIADIAEWMNLDIAAPFRSAADSLAGFTTEAHAYADGVFQRFADGDTAVAALGRELAATTAEVKETVKAVEASDPHFKTLKSNLAADDGKSAKDAAKKAAKEIARFKDELKGLVHELNPAQKASDEFLRKMNLLDRGFRDGILTMEQYEDLIIALTEDTTAYEREIALLADAEERLIGPTEQRVRQLRAQIEGYGKSATELERLVLRQLEEARALAAINGAMPEHLAFYDRLIEQQGQLVSAMGQKEAMDFQVSFWTDLGSVAHQTFNSIADGGKDAFTRLKDTIKNTFFEWLYQMVARPWIINVSGQMSGSGVQGAVSQAITGGSGSGVTGFTNPSSLYGTFGSYMATGFMNAIAGTGVQAGVNAGMAMMSNGYWVQGAGMTAGSVALPGISAYGFGQQYGVAGGIAGGVATTALAGGIAGGVGAAAAGTGIGAGIMSGAGAALGGLGPVGWAVLIGAAILGAMNQEDTPRAKIMNSASGNPDDFEDNQVVQSPFGYVGFRDGDTRGVSGKDTRPFFEMMAGLDAVMVQGLGLDASKVSDISTSLNAKDFGRNNVEDAMRDGFKERTAMILEQAGFQFFADKVRALSGDLKAVATGIPALVDGAIAFKQLSEYMEGIDPEAAMALAESVGGSQNLLAGLGPAMAAFLDPEMDPFEVVRAQMEDGARSLTEMWSSQNSELDTFIANMDWSKESLAQLGAMAQQHYETELQLVQQLAQARQGVGDLTDSSIESIRKSVMTDEEKYDYLDKKLDAEFAKLGTLTDPAQIMALVQQMNADATEAFGLLGKDEQKALAEGFVARLEDIDERAQAQLDVAEAAIKAEREELGEAIKSAIKDGLAEAAEAQLAAAAAQQQAADVQMEAAETQRQTALERDRTAMSEAGGN